MIYKTLPLSKLCSIEKGTTGIMKAVAGPYPMVTLAEQRTSHIEYQFDAKAVIVPLISSTGHGHASMKRVHYQEGKFALGSILCALIPNDETELNARFLYNYLSFFKDSLLVPLMRGAANVSLSIKSISSVTIPLPPLDEQLAINELVEVYSLKTKAFQDEFQTQQTLLAQLRQAILQEAVQGKLTEKWRAESEGLEPTETGSVLLARIRAEKAELIRQGRLRKEKPLPPITDAEKPYELPEGGVWCRLGDLGNFCGGGTPSKNNPNYWKGDVPWVSPKDIKMDDIYDSIDHISTDAVQNSSTKLIQPNSILMVVRGMTLLKRFPISVNKVPVTLNQDMKAITFFFEEVRPYIFTCLRGLENLILKVINTATHGTGKLDTDLLINFLIPLPPIAEQQAIVTQVEQLLRQVSGLETENKLQQAEVGRLMQAVLREAFAGKNEVAEAI